MMEIFRKILDYCNCNKSIEIKQILAIEKRSTILLECNCQLNVEQISRVDSHFSALSKKHGINFMVIDSNFKPIAVIKDKVKS